LKTPRSVLSKNHGHSPQTLTFKDEKKANLLRRSILDAKSALLAGRDRDGIIVYRLADVPKLEGVLPQCCRTNCRKLFHGIKMQGYQSVANPRIFVHRKCLEAVINQGWFSLKLEYVFGLAEGAIEPALKPKLRR